MATGTSGCPNGQERTLSMSFAINKRETRDQMLGAGGVIFLFLFL
jgi:hypothetical protein